MTLLGKILVFVTVALSFMMLAWALGIYLGRIDWSNNKASTERPAGVLVARQQRITDANDVLIQNSARWRQALRGNDGKDGRPVRDGLLAWEKRRVDDRQWYAEQLKLAKHTDNGADGKPVAIKRITLNKEGQTIPDPANAGRPTMAPAERRKDEQGQGGGQLYCYDWYVAELDRLTKALEAAQLEYQKAVKMDTELTEEAIGTKDKPKGLRQRLIDEQEKYRLVLEELKDVGDRQTNSRVDAELLLAREEQLKRRVAELETAAKEGNK
jgi:hypothetical protein